MPTYSNEQGRFVLEGGQGKFNTTDPVVNGDWDKAKYVSPADCAVFKTNSRRRATPGEKAEDFEELLRRSDYEYDGGRIVAKRDIGTPEKPNIERFKSSKIISRDPPFTPRPQKVRPNKLEQATG